MSNLLEQIWNHCNNDYHQYAKDVTDLISIIDPTDKDEKELPEGLYIFRTYGDGLFKPTPTHPTTIDVLINRLERKFIKPIPIYRRDTSKDWLYKVEDNTGMIGQAIEAQFATMGRYRKDNFFKDYDITITIKGKKSIEKPAIDYDYDGLVKCFKKVEYKPDEDGITVETVEDVRLFVGLILAYPKGKKVIDIFNLLTTDDWIQLDELIAMMREINENMLRIEERNNINPTSFIDNSKEMDIAIERELRASNMSSLTRILDLHSNGKIAIRDKGSLREENIMINKIVKAYREYASPINSFRDLILALEDIYSKDSIEHILKTSGDTLAVKGKLYIKLADNFYVLAASVKSNGQTVKLYEPALISLALNESYSSNTINDYLANWINVNDLSSRL